MKLALVASSFPNYENYCPNNIGMKAGLNRLGIDWKFFSCRNNENWTNEVIAYDPSFIVYALPDVIRREEWRIKIQNKLPSAIKVFWYGDLRVEGMNYPEGDCSKNVDAMFVSNDGQKDFYNEKLKIKDVYFLPLGAEPQKPNYVKKFDFDMVFIGAKNYTGKLYSRAKMIQDFEDNGCMRIDSGVPRIREKIYKAMPEIYRSSKISLDISHFTNIPGYTSNRYWNIPAFQGFALTKRFPRCEEFYPESMRAYFDTLEEGLELRNYYLTHEDHRVKMMEKAHKHSENHTCDKRFLEMFKKMNVKI
jgi:spore maturation protein CgeB